MAIRDCASMLFPAVALAPAVRNAGANGTSVDLVGYESSCVFVSVGAVTDGAHTIKLQESADNATWNDVDASDLIGAFAALAANTVQKVGYRGNKRYIRVVSTSTGATGAAFSAVVCKSHARHNGY